MADSAFIGTLRSLIEHHLRRELTTMPDPAVDGGCFYGLPLGDLGTKGLACTAERIPADWLDPKEDTFPDLLASSRPIDRRRAQIWCLFEYMAVVLKMNDGPIVRRFNALTYNKNRKMPHHVFRYWCMRGAFHIASLALDGLQHRWSSLGAADAPRARLKIKVLEPDKPEMPGHYDGIELPVWDVPLKDDEVRERPSDLHIGFVNALQDRGLEYKKKRGSFAVAGLPPPDDHSFAKLLNTLWATLRTDHATDQWFQRHRDDDLIAWLRLDNVAKNTHGEPKPRLPYPSPFICFALTLAFESFHRGLRRIGSGDMNQLTRRSASGSDDHPAQVRDDARHRLDKLATALRSSGGVFRAIKRFDPGLQEPTCSEVHHDAELGLWTVNVHWPKEIEEICGVPPDSLPAQFWVWRRGEIGSMEQVKAIAFEPCELEDGVIEYRVEGFAREGSVLGAVLGGQTNVERLRYPPTQSWLRNFGDAADPRMWLVIGIEIPA